MAQYESALQMVLFHEGTDFSDNPSDSGGPSRYGISLRFYKSKVQPDATAETIKNLTVNDAASIYENYFWNRAPFAEIQSQALANRVFDLAVNMDITPAIHCLQLAVNDCKDDPIPLDGILGVKTLNAVNSIPEQNLYIQLITRAMMYYRNIVIKNPKNEIFLSGWLNRLRTLP